MTLISVWNHQRWFGEDEQWTRVYGEIWWWSLSIDLHMESTHGFCMNFWNEKSERLGIEVSSEWVMWWMCCYRIYLLLNGYCWHWIHIRLHEVWGWGPSWPKLLPVHTAYSNFAPHCLAWTWVLGLSIGHVPPIAQASPDMLGKPLGLFLIISFNPFLGG